MTSTDYLEDRLARLELTLNPTSSQLRVSSPSFSECSSGSTEYFSSTSDDGARNSEYGSPLVEGTSESQHSGQNQVSQPRPSERIIVTAPQQEVELPTGGQKRQMQRLGFPMRNLISSVRITTKQNQQAGVALEGTFSKVIQPFKLLGQLSSMLKAKLGEE
ncbi:hypothetical protein C8R43DRAFT_942479 [Mycena crocata]|nr:hypothetical protein C8R43DRAFT_942479 [Mycena crocata]